MKTRTGYLFQKRPGGNFFVRTMINGKPIVKSTGIANRREAEKRRSEIMAPYAIGEKSDVLKAVSARLADLETQQAALVAEQNPPPPLENIWSLFLESPLRPDSGDSTLNVYKFKWKSFLVWLESNRPDVQHLHEVTAKDAANYAIKLTARKISASTFNQHKNLLRMVWRVMADECRLKENPWDAIAPKKLTPLKTRKRSLTPAQFESLIAAVEGDEDNPDLKDLFTTLAWTGLRLADAVLLTWGAVDFSKRVISLAPMKTARRQGKIVHIPIFPAVMQILNDRQSGSVINPKAVVFPELADKYQRDATAISKDISDAFDKAGMLTTEKRADRKKDVVVYGAHSLRHFFVTAATAVGMPDAMIKTITGHSSDSMLGHYQQIGADLAADLAGRIQGTGTKVLADNAKSPFDTMKESIAELAAKLNAENWEAIKAKLEALASL